MIVDGGVVGWTVTWRRRSVSAGAVVERHAGKMNDAIEATASVAQSTANAVGEQSFDGRRARRIEPIFTKPAVQLHPRDPEPS